MNSFSVCLSFLMTTYPSGVALPKAATQEKESRLTVLFTNDRTAVPSSMKLYVSAKLEMEDIRGRPVSKEAFLDCLKMKGASNSNAFRFVFVDAKGTHLQTLRELLELLETHAPPGIETIVHIQIQRETKNPPKGK